MGPLGDTLGHPMALQRPTWDPLVPKSAHHEPKYGPKGSFGAPLGAHNLKKQQKHTGILLFSRFAQSQLFAASGLPFCSPGSQKCSQGRPRGSSKTPKAPILSPKGEPKSVKNRQWASQVHPGTPKGPKTDQKVAPDPPGTQISPNFTPNQPKTEEHKEHMPNAGHKTDTKINTLN